MQEYPDKSYPETKDIFRTYIYKDWAWFYSYASIEKILKK